MHRSFVVLALFCAVAAAATAPEADDMSDMQSMLLARAGAKGSSASPAESDLRATLNAKNFGDSRRRYDRRRRFSDSRRRRTFYDRRRRRTFYNRRRRRRTYYCGPRRNGGWSGWGNWGTCNSSNGYRYRYRSCNNPTRSCGGSYCSGSSSSSQYVRVHCARHNWGGWSACSATCGGGIQHRYRGVKTWPSCGGNGCPTGAQSQSCNTQPCPVDCAVGYWGGYGSCSKSCGGGSQRRTRTLKQPKWGGKACPSHYQDRSCGTSNCAVHCTVNPFSAWSACTKSCGKGTQSRSRTIKSINRFGGYACPYLKETRSCNAQACAVDGSVGAWRSWSTCTVSCGGGSMDRSRSASPPSFGGKAHAHTAETRACNTFTCSTDCNFGPFSAWSTCTKTCGTGSQKRSRTTTEPTFGGKACPHSAETRACNTASCAVDCNTESWQAWSTCTKSCGTGSQKRSRKQTEPQFGGKACPHYAETRDCNVAECPIDGGWTAFDAWSTCTKSCDEGTTFRARRCTNPPAQYGGKDCPDHAREEKGCNMHVCHCPTCQYIKGHVQIQHTTEHADTAVHGPRSVHKDCAKRGPNSAPAMCGASFVMAHRCTYNQDTGACGCVCKKPHHGQDRNTHKLVFPTSKDPEELKKVKMHHPGKPWTDPAITVVKSGHNPTYGNGKTATKK